jgi:uncharacterized protein involved in exopolysaccharide biosynthesis
VSQDWPERYGGTEGDLVAHLLRVLQDPIGALRRRWIWMLLCLVTGLTATAAFVALLEPSYLAKATVLISSQQIPEDFVRSTVRENSLANLNAMVGEVLSQKNLSTLIEGRDLYPEDREQSTMLGLIGRMRADISIYQQQQRLSSSRGDNSQIFAITYEYEDRSVAALIANELASFFVEASLERRSRQAQRTTEFLRRELIRAEQELREINREISEFQREHRGELPGDLEPTLRKLERLEQQRQSLSVQLVQSENRIALLAGDGGAPSTPEAMLQDLRMQLASQLGIHTDEHPNVIALRRRIELMENATGGEAVALDRSAVEREERLKAARNDHTLLQSELEAVEREIGDLDLRVDRIPTRREELGALEERSAVLRENYLDFLRKVQDAELAQTLESAQQGPRVTVLDRAQPPDSPTRPPLLFAMGGAAGSLALALALVLLLEVFDPVVLDADQLELLHSGPVLGSLPRA